MKIAELSDLDTLHVMAMKFVEATGYKEMSDSDYIKCFIKTFLEQPHDTHIAVLDDHGFIAGQVTPFLFGYGSLASEVAWWIDPSARGENKGIKLMEAFEYWAKNIANCKYISMTSLDKDVEKIYKKKGYKLYERAYMKIL